MNHISQLINKIAQHLELPFSIHRSGTGKRLGYGAGWSVSSVYPVAGHKCPGTVSAAGTTLREALEEFWYIIRNPEADALKRCIDRVQRKCVKFHGVVKCPLCEKQIRLRKDGRIRAHTLKGRRCASTDATPSEAQETKDNLD